MNDSTRRFAFSTITPRLLPSPTFAHWDGEEDMGLSPRTAPRVRLVYTLPLYDSPVIHEFIAWRAKPVLFTFLVMDLVQWMTLTRATPRMMSHSFSATGMPLLFWQLNFVLESHTSPENSLSQNVEMDDQEEEELSDSHEFASEDCFESEIAEL